MYFTTIKKVVSSMNEICDVVTIMGPTSISCVASLPFINSVASWDSKVSALTAHFRISLGVSCLGTYCFSNIMNSGCMFGSRIPEMLVHFLHLNKIKTKRISNHMSQNILFTIEHR